MLHQIIDNFISNDHAFEYKGLVFYFNSNDEYIKLNNGTKINFANKVLLFDSSKDHQNTIEQIFTIK